MAYDTRLAARIERQFQKRQVAFAAKPMMGGLVFMVDDKMCVGVHLDRLLVRLDPADIATALKQPGCEPMSFTGRMMKSFVVVTGGAVNTDVALGRWVEPALAFNPRAIRSTPEKKKQQPKTGGK